MKTIEEMRALCEAATLGPWIFRPNDQWVVRGKVKGAPEQCFDKGVVCDIDRGHIPPRDPLMRDANAAFIAAAREFVPFAISEIERLRAAMVKLGCDRGPKACDAEIDSLRAEVSVLRAKVEQQQEWHTNLDSSYHDLRDENGRLSLLLAESKSPYLVKENTELLLRSMDLRAENERLRAENESTKSTILNVASQKARADNKNQKLRGLIWDAEWCESDREDNSYCPWCHVMWRCGDEAAPSHDSSCKARDIFQSGGSGR